MVTIREAPADRMIERLAEEMEKMHEFKPPEWARFVKTGVHKERPPSQKNWWYIRSASMLRKISMSEDGLGTSRLRRVYGGRKNRGHKPERKKLASGSIIREMLQQLEAAGFVKGQKGKGRKITAKGKAFLKSAAGPAKA
jgi:small subunit ribosomal protein S19e